MVRELSRKSIHMLLGFFFAEASVFFPHYILFLFAYILFFALLFLRKTRVSLFLRSVPRVSYGEFFFVFGVLLTLSITGGATHLFQLGMVVLAVADPCASLAGMYFGTHKYALFGEVRSLEGSFVCMLAASGVFLLFGYSFVVAVIAGCILALVEAVSCRGSDNFFLPVVTALFAFFLG